MKTNIVTETIPGVLYFIIGIVSLVMAFKSILSSKFISFHEAAAGKSLQSIDKPLQLVILVLMRVAGLGFLVVALLLMVFPLVNYFFPDLFLKYAIPGIAFIYCTGLFFTNYYLHKQTKAKTPWRGSVAAMIILVIGIIISAL